MIYLLRRDHPSHPWNGEVNQQGHRIPEAIELKYPALVVEEEYGSTKHHGPGRDDQLKTAVAPTEEQGGRQVFSPRRIWQHSLQEGNIFPAQIGTEEVKRLAAVGAVTLAIVFRIVVAGALLGLLSSGWIPQGYVVRFAEIAASNGTPYRDFAVEYPPVSFAAIELVGAEDPQGTGARFLWLAIAADAAVAVALLRGWGRRAAGAYLIGSIPLLGPDLRLRSMYMTLDIIPVALATVAMALALRRRERAGGVLLAAAVLAKVWPLVLAPAFLWARRRALVWFGLALTVGTTVWVLWAGVGGIGQVATQRHTSGWQVESTVGTLIWTLGDEEVRIVKDSQRIGTAPVWATSLLMAVGALGVALVWLRARRTPDEVGAACLASVALLLFVAPIYSYPFVLWLLPWSAIALTEGRARLSYLGFGVVALTAFIYATLGGELVREASPVMLFVLLLRNAATGAIPIVYLFGRPWRRSVDEQESSTAVLLGTAPALRAAHDREG